MPIQVSGNPPITSTDPQRSATTLPFAPKYVFVKKQCHRASRTKAYITNILKYDPKAQITYLKGDFEYPMGLDAKGKYEYAREMVIIGERVEDFVRTFPSPGDIVENIDTVVNPVWMCPCGCEFCYLQLTRPAETTLYTNFNKLERELETAPFAHTAILTIWSMISYAAKRRFLKIPDNLMEVSDWLRTYFVQTRINSNGKAIAFLFGKQGQIYGGLKQKDAKTYLGIARADFIANRERIEFLYMQNSKFPLWLNTCEFSDLPALDHLTGDIDFLMGLLPKFKELRLKFRTKNANVDSLVRQPGYDRVHVTISLDPQSIIDKYEHGTSSLDARIDALQKLQSADGIRLRIAMEPVIFYTGWGKEYADMIGQVFSKVEPKRIKEVTIGFPRYRKQLSSMILKHYPQTTLFASDQDLQQPESQLDARLRYSYERRAEMVHTIIDQLKKYEITNISLGAENPRLWDKVGLKKESALSTSVYQFDEPDTKEPAVTNTEPVSQDQKTSPPAPIKPKEQPQEQGELSLECVVAFEYIQQAREEIDDKRFAMADRRLGAVLEFDEEVKKDDDFCWEGMYAVRINEALKSARTWQPIKLVGFVSQLGLPEPFEINEQEHSVVHLQITDLDGTTIDCLRMPTQSLSSLFDRIRKGKQLYSFLGSMVPVTIPLTGGKTQSVYRFYIKDVSEDVSAEDLIVERPHKMEWRDTVVDEKKTKGRQIKVAADSPFFVIQEILKKAKMAGVKQNQILDYIKQKVAEQFKIKELDGKAAQLGMAIEFCILQAFSQQRDVYSYKLHSLLIGPPDVGKGFIPRIAGILNVAYDELPSNSPKLTSAGLVAHVKQGSKKNVSVPGILPCVSGGLVAVQDYHEVSKSKRRELFGIFSKMMEDGEVIDSTSAHETHDAVVSLHLDTNRYSEVYRDRAFNSFTDIDIPMNILSRFDFIMEIPKDAQRQRETSAAIAGTTELEGRSRHRGLEEWAVELRMLVAYLRSEYDKVTFPEDVRKYIKERLDEAVRPHSKRQFFADNYEDMQNRVMRSILKMVKAIACANQEVEATKQHVDYAMKFVNEKLKFVASIDDRDIAGPAQANPDDQRRALIREHFGGKDFSVAAVKEKIDEMMGTKVTEKTYYGDFDRLGIKQVKQGVWSLKAETSEVKTLKGENVKSGGHQQESAETAQKRNGQPKAKKTPPAQKRRSR